MSKVQKTITGVRSGLQWQVQEVRHDSPDIEIDSDPERRIHTIRFPVAGDAVREIEYLHELAHAWLAENVHHLMSTAIFRSGISAAELEPFIAPKRTAADWFADALLMKWCPREETDEIREHVEYVLVGATHASPGEMRFNGGLICAQAVYWKIGRLESLPHIYRPVVDVLLRFKPETPSIMKMQALVNELAALVTEKRLRLANDNGLEVWDIV